MLKLRCEVELDVISRRSDALAKLLRFGEDMMANRRIKDFRRCSGILVIVVDMVKRDVDLIAKVVLRLVLKLPLPQI
jgi:hypothetical protein